MKHSPQLIFSLVLLLCAWPLHAQPLPDPLQKGLHTLRQLHGFSADFTQTLRYQDGSHDRYRGTIAVKRPGKFFWHYTAPYAQSYISNGHGVWHYEPDLMQAVRMNALDGIDNIAIQLLNGRIGTKDVTLLARARETLGKESFTIRVHDRMTLTLTFDSQGRLTTIQHRDALGNSNTIRLSHLKFQSPDDTLFDFTPPAGTDIVIEGAPTE